jgi:hypothetical protein
MKCDLEFIGHNKTCNLFILFVKIIFDMAANRTYLSAVYSK